MTMTKLNLRKKEKLKKLSVQIKESDHLLLNQYLEHLDKEGYDVNLNDILPQIIIKFIKGERGFKEYLKQQKQVKEDIVVGISNVESTNTESHDF